MGLSVIADIYRTCEQHTARAGRNPRALIAADKDSAKMAALVKIAR
jgi:hypothetical protein